MTISRVSGSFVHAENGPQNSLSVTLPLTPQSGHSLVACIGTRDYSANRTVSSISQTGVTWSSQIQGSGSLQVSEIWLGTIGANASTSVTISFSGSASANASNLADICEYTEALVSDVSQANNGSGSILSTGTTSTTTSNNELWIGTGCTGATSHTSPTNGFTQLDGNASAYGAISYLEKIVSSTGTATCSVTLGVATGWVGAIATLKTSGGTPTYTITADADAHSSISPSGQVMVNQGANQTFNMSAISGYHITHVYVDSVDQGAISSYTFYNVTANHTISVTSEIDGTDIVARDLTVNRNATFNNGLTVTNGNATISGNATVNGMINSHATGSAPIAGSNAGMILDCYTYNHTDGLGIQSGGIWLKYDNQFDFYRDNGTTIINPLHLDNTGDMTLNVWGSKLTFYDQYGHAASIQAENSSPTYPWPFLHIQFGILADDISAMGFLATTSNGLENGVGGGAIMMGHGFTASSDMPVIQLMDVDCDTLWIKYCANPAITQIQNMAWGNIELNNLYVRGHIQSGTASWLTSESPINITQAYCTSVTGYTFVNTDGNHYRLDLSTGTVPVSLKTAFRIFCGGEIDVYSDQRDKNLIGALTTQNALDAIVKLNPIQFTWKPETKKGNNVVVGFFAQEVAKAIPEAVTVHEGERYSDEHTLNYNVLTTYALSAIQGLGLKHEENAERFRKLTQEIEGLRSEIKRITQAGRD